MTRPLTLALGAAFVVVLAWRWIASRPGAATVRAVEEYLGYVPTEGM